MCIYKANCVLCPLIFFFFLSRNWMSTCVYCPLILFSRVSKYGPIIGMCLKGRVKCQKVQKQKKKAAIAQRKYALQCRGIVRIFQPTFTSRRHSQTNAVTVSHEKRPIRAFLSLWQQRERERERAIREHQTKAKSVKNCLCLVYIIYSDWTFAVSGVFSIS